MGIRGLLKYMADYCQDGCEPVNIAEIARKYKKETGLDPVIAFDISSCIREIYKKNQIDWLDADRYKKFESVVNQFLESFTNIGIKFFVVFDGVTPETKLPVWIERKRGRTNTLAEMFKSLQNNNNKNEALNIDGTVFVLPPGAYSVLESIFQSNDNCICKYSVLEADEELANYVANNECFAYLTGDSDFIIYDGPKYCLSIQNLDLESMTTINYNRNALAKNLNIEVAQLPLFALLCGSDAIPFDKVKYFQHELCPKFPVGKVSYDILFSAIAKFVNELPQGREILKHLPKVSRRIFKTEKFVNHLKTGLKNYWGDISYPVIPKIYDENWDQILEKCYENHVGFSFDLIIYNILFGYSVKIGPLLESMEDTNLPPSALACLPLRQKLYGILLLEKPNKEDIFYIEEWLAFSKDSLNASFKVTPSFIEHPGLLTLWNERDQSRETVKARWRTFCKAISPKLKYREIMALPKDLILPILALYYLNNELKTRWETFGREFGSNYIPKLENFEIEALLAQAVIVNNSTIEEIDEIIKILKRSMDCWNFNMRAVHLSSLFQNICRLMFSLSVACGNLISRNEASASKYFDGKLFMHLYDMQTTTDCKIWKYCVFEQESRENYEKFLSLITSSE